MDMMGKMNGSARALSTFGGTCETGFSLFV